MLCLSLYYMLKVCLFSCWAATNSISFYFFFLCPLFSETVCFHTFTFSSPPSLLFKHRLTANPSIPNQPLYIFFLLRNAFMCVARSQSSLKTACLKIYVIAHIYITLALRIGQSLPRVYIWPLSFWRPLMTRGTQSSHSKHSLVQDSVGEHEP